MISHDLIGRLAVLRASSELLLEDNLLPEEDRRLRATMAHGVSHLHRLIHEVLGVFSLEAPFPVVQASDDIERLYAELSGAPALLAARDGAPVSVITKADLLEFVAHQRKASG